MTQSNQDRIDDLESKLAALSYRIEDMQKELNQKIKLIEQYLEMLMKIPDAKSETIQVKAIGFPGISNIVINKKYEQL